MAISKLNGNDYIVLIDTTTPVTEETNPGTDYRPVMCMSSNGFNGTTEAIEVADKCSGGYADSLPGTNSWEITGTGNAIDESLEPSADSYQELFELWQNKTTFWMKMANVPGNGKAPIIREGRGYLSSYSETADTDSPYSFDFTFTGKQQVNGVSTT